VRRRLRRQPLSYHRLLSRTYLPPSVSEDAAFEKRKRKAERAFDKLFGGRRVSQKNYEVTLGAETAFWVAEERRQRARMQRNRRRAAA
jgi:hypothetical protein